MQKPEIEVEERNDKSLVERLMIFAEKANEKKGEK